MNDLVDLMNNALRAAVARAGDSVHFIDYDEYVGLTGGRYCQPGQDEAGKHGANRRDLFFYKMGSKDSPWLLEADKWGHDELKRRNNPINDDGNIQPVNRTLNALYGALLQEAIQNSHGVAAIQDDNANHDLDEEVQEQEHIAGGLQKVEASDLRAFPAEAHHFGTWNLNGSRALFEASGESQQNSQTSLERLAFTFVSQATDVAHSSAVTLTKTRDSTAISGFNSELTAQPVGTRGPVSAAVPPFRNSTSNTFLVGTVPLPTASVHLSQPALTPSIENGTTLGSVLRIANNATRGDVSEMSFGSKNVTGGFNTGTVIANQTHVLLAGNKIVEKVSLQRLIVPDGTGRIFHPTQAGHSLIANLILFEMAAQNAKAKGK